MVDRPDARKVVLVISSDRGLRESVDKIVARAQCRAVAVPDYAAADRAIERVQPVLMLVDPLQRDAPSACLRSRCPIVEIPVRTSRAGVRRFAKPSTEAVRWLTNLVAERCAESH